MAVHHHRPGQPQPVLAAVYVEAHLRRRGGDRHRTFGAAGLHEREGGALRLRQQLPQDRQVEGVEVDPLVVVAAETTGRGGVDQLHRPEQADVIRPEPAPAVRQVVPGDSGADPASRLAALDGADAEADRPRRDGAGAVGTRCGGSGSKLQLEGQLRRRCRRPARRSAVGRDQRIEVGTPQRGRVLHRPGRPRGEQDSSHVLAVVGHRARAVALARPAQPVRRVPHLDAHPVRRGPPAEHLGGEQVTGVVEIHDVFVRGVRLAAVERPTADDAPDVQLAVVSHRLGPVPGQRGRYEGSRSGARHAPGLLRDLVLPVSQGPPTRW